MDSWDFIEIKKNGIVPEIVKYPFSDTFSVKFGNVSIVCDNEDEAKEMLEAITKWNRSRDNERN